jgi:hypothetical protein
MRLKLLQTTKLKTALHLVLTLNVLSRPLRQQLRSALKLRLNLKMCQLRCPSKLKRTPRLWQPKLRLPSRFRHLW